MIKTKLYPATATSATYSYTKSILKENGLSGGLLNATEPSSNINDVWDATHWTNCPTPPPPQIPSGGSAYPRIRHSINKFFPCKLALCGCLKLPGQNKDSPVFWVEVQIFQKFHHPFCCDLIIFMWIWKNKIHLCHHVNIKKRTCSYSDCFHHLPPRRWSLSSELQPLYLLKICSIFLLSADTLGSLL